MRGCGIEARANKKGDEVMRNQTWNNFRVGLPLFLRDEFCTALLFIATFVPLTALVCLVCGILLPHPPIPFSSLWWNAVFCLLLWLLLVILLGVAVAKRVVVLGREKAMGL